MRVILYYALYYFYRVLSLAILIFCILSWFAGSNAKVYNIYRKLGYYLEPLFTPAKLLLSRLRLNLPVDFSPWLTMILINFVYSLICNILF